MCHGDSTRSGNVYTCDVYTYDTKRDNFRYGDVTFMITLRAMIQYSEEADPRLSCPLTAQTTPSLLWLPGTDSRENATINGLLSSARLCERAANRRYIVATRRDYISYVVHPGPARTPPSRRPVPPPFVVLSAVLCPIYDPTCDITALPADLDVTSEIGVQHSERNLRARGTSQRAASSLVGYSDSLDPY